jgi:putative acetyltransferase
MRVRRATLLDAEAFVAVLAAVAAEGRWIGTEAPVDIDARVARLRATMQKGADALWVLEDEQAGVVGNLGLHETHAAGVMMLGMAILEPYRGRGGGRALIEAALAHARDSPLHKLELEAWPDNARAIALYESYGFEREGLRRRHYRRRDGTLRDSLIMALLLEPEAAEPEPDQSRPEGGT